MSAATGAGRLPAVRACVFDAYGTLFDVASAAARCAGTLGEAAPRLAALWRDKQLQYSWLRAAGTAAAILSNGTPAMLAAAVDHAGLAGAFDHVLSVEEAGVFKLYPRVYQLAGDRLGLAAEAIAFVSSNGWDP